MDSRVKIGVAVVLNMIIVVLQILIGLYAHSLALITDAVHNFQDVVSLIIAYIAIVFMAKKPTAKMTFGYLRSEVMAGFINASFLLGAIFLIIISSVERFLEPVEVDSVLVIVMGGVAFVINAFSAWLLGFHHDGHGHDLNIKAAYLHLLSDAGISLGVVAGGVFIYLFGINWIDPLISILFSLYIFKETLPVLKKSYMILMESVPPGFDIQEVKSMLKEIEGIIDVHDIHLWALSSKDIYLSAHVVIDKDKSITDFDRILRKIKEKAEELGINHITIQPEVKGFKCEYTY